MPNLIEEWKKKKGLKAASHKKIVKKLSKINEKKLNALADEMHEKAFNQIDCLNCANCCKSIPPIINETDIRRISKQLGMKVTDFKEQYTIQDEDLDMVMKKSPCPFLGDDNKCAIYEYRPKACREYPHTNNYEFTRNLKLHASNSTYCPAVFYILEEISTKFLKP
jgi:Fe-S-cluster containining protein